MKYTDEQVEEFMKWLYEEKNELDELDKQNNDITYSTGRVVSILRVIQKFNKIFRPNFDKG